jgi:putative transposase
MIVCKAFKFRLYPTSEHKKIFAKQFGHARFVYNYYLARREAVYKETGKGLSYQDCACQMKTLKKEPKFLWLKEAHSQVLQQSLMNLDKAFKNFFKNLAAYPHFKSKHAKQSICFPQGFKIKNGIVYLPKVGWIKTVMHRPIEGVIKSCTVSKTKTGKFFVSILCEVDLVIAKQKSTQVGIDLGLKDFATLSTGERIGAPKHLRKSEKRLKRLQRGLSRKAQESGNRKRARKRLSLQHEYVANKRKDFHHKESRKLVNRFGRIVFEDLNIAGMMKNHNLAKSIGDAGWSQFVQFCIYKQGWAGGEVIKRDRWFASSKICSHCGVIKQDLKLSERQWTCSGCDVSHDRDRNAAINLVNETTLGVRESNAWEIREGVGRSAQEAQAFRPG